MPEAVLERIWKPGVPGASRACLLAPPEPGDAGADPGRLQRRVARRGAAQPGGCRCCASMPPSTRSRRPRLRHLADRPRRCWSPARAASDGFLRITVERETLARPEPGTARALLVRARGSQLLSVAARQRTLRTVRRLALRPDPAANPPCWSATLSCARSRAWTCRPRESERWRGRSPRLPDRLSRSRRPLPFRRVTLREGGDEADLGDRGDRLHRRAARAPTGRRRRSRSAAWFATAPPRPAERSRPRAASSPSAISPGPAGLDRGARRASRPPTSSST